MHFRELPLSGAYLIELEPHADERGLFARTFCAREFGDHGLHHQFVQCNTSWNARKGTLRGLHYQRPPAAEAKLIRCTAGAVWDVIVDLRPASSTYLRHIGVELSAANRLALYVPEMFAHGFQTLVDGAELFYQMTAFYAPDLASGIQFDDPGLRIAWPLDVSTISERDRVWPLLP